MGSAPFLHLLFWSMACGCPVILLSVQITVLEGVFHVRGSFCSHLKDVQESYASPLEPLGCRA